MRATMLIALFSAVILVSFGYSSAYQNNGEFEVGQRANRTCFADDLVYDEKVEKHNKFGLGNHFEETRTYTVPVPSKITKIRAVDHKRAGATVHIIKGGVGSNFVTLRFTNEKHGFQYRVEIYATKK